MNQQGGSWNQMWRQSFITGNFSYTDLPPTCRIQVFLENYPGVSAPEILSSLESPMNFASGKPLKRERQELVDELSRLVQFKRIFLVKQPGLPVVFYHTDPCLMPNVYTELHPHSVIGPKIFYSREKTNHIDWFSTLKHAVRQTGFSGISNADLREVFFYFSPPRNNHGQISLHDHLDSLRRNSEIVLRRVYTESRGLQYRYFPC